MNKAFYEDSFFNDECYDQFENHIFKEFNNQVQQMNNHFNNLYNSIFQTKTGIQTHEPKQKTNSREKNNDSNQNLGNSFSEQTNSQAEAEVSKSKETIPQQKYFHSSRFCSYSDSNGLKYIKSKVSDDINGTQIKEIRGIGPQSITWERAISKEGHVKDKETRHNIEEEEKDKFMREWEEISKEHFGKNRNRSIKSSDSVALQ
jgi:hypothetical protein